MHLLILFLENALSFYQLQALVSMATAYNNITHYIQSYW